MALRFEQSLSKKIEDLFYEAEQNQNYNLARKLYARLAEEQLEEEEKFGELVKQMEMFEGNLALILDFDKRLGEGASH